MAQPRSRRRRTHRARTVGIIGGARRPGRGRDGRRRRRSAAAAAPPRAGGRARPGRPTRRSRPAELREDDPLGGAARAADRTALVQADDGVLLAVEEIGPRDAPLTVVFVHGYTLSMASWTFQRRTLAADLATANGHRPDARLVFYDQRGHGASGRGAAERSTIAAARRATWPPCCDARVPRGPGGRSSGTRWAA